MIVTGVCGGIGAEIAQWFVAQGWRVIGVDLRMPEVPLASVDYEVCDLSDAHAIESLAQRLMAESPEIATLVNCAATQHINKVHELSVAEWDHTLAVNVRAPWLLTKALRGGLRRAAQLFGHAEVINISSVHAIATSPGMAAYAASKAALSSLTRSTSIEYASDGIRVNSIAPGAVATPMLTEHLSTDAMDKLLTRQLIPRLIEPSAIAGTVAYLISPAAANSTGQEFVIDSGVLSQLATEVA